MKLRYPGTTSTGRFQASSLNVRLIRLFALACLVLGGSLPASAANHYLRAGATGDAQDGSSWAKAWPTFASAKWTRGDTYFVAGGTYAENVVVAAPLSGVQWIRVKKANAADNAKDADWSAAYATDQTLINGTVKLSNGYIEFDGVTGSGTAGHGFNIYTAVDTHVLTLALSTGPYHVWHCEMRGRTRLSDKGFDGLYNNNLSPQKGLHVAHCWIHDCGRNGFTIGAMVGTSYDDYGMLFENNVIEETGGALDGGHSQALQISYDAPNAYLIIRNNLIKNNIGSAAISST